MSLPKYVYLLAIVTASLAINRPVYKVVLTQQGYTQFLQYDIDTPVLREFTFCSWIRIYDLDGDQTIFAYVVKGNNRVLRLWMGAGGKSLKISITGRVTNTPVNIMKDVWRHVCLTYQAGYGAWAIYLDAQLLTCDTALSLHGFALPSGGSIIVGYGTDDTGKPNGLEGEIFGSNMILASTIQINHSAMNNFFQDSSFRINKTNNRIKNKENKAKYIVLNDLKIDGVQNNFEKSFKRLNKNKNITPKRNPHSFIDDTVSLSAITKGVSTTDIPYEDETVSSSGSKSFFGNLDLDNDAKLTPSNLRLHKKINDGNLHSKPIDSPTISEFETPPPLPKSLSANSQGLEKLPRPTFIYNIGDELKRFTTQNGSNTEAEALLDIETPPSPQVDNKVYGQWASSKFANSVLNYLKSINFHKNDKKPATIQLPKISDSYPYATEFKVTKLRPPIQFQRSFLTERHRQFQKRDIHTPEINVKIIENDLRSTIQKNHAETRPKDVQITNRGSPQYLEEQRLYRNVDNGKSKANSVPHGYEEVVNNKVNTTSNTEKYDKLGDFEGLNLMSILPILKSLENYVRDSHNAGSAPVEHSSDMYSKSLSGNKWHNVKAYSQNYTPRHYNLSNDEINDTEHKRTEIGKINQPVGLEYTYENHNLEKRDPLLKKARALATSVANQSNPDSNSDSISILKYNHGFLSTQGTKKKSKSSKSTHSNKFDEKDNFNKHVKLGNALNEREIIGYSEELKKKSFVGGNEDVPDINKYRSDLDNENTKVPSSLGLKICRSVDLYSKALYVHPDQSIHPTHIVSSLKRTSVAIEFIHQNYKECSHQGSQFDKNRFILIDWGKTPVRLFGGAYPKTTTDLCGFF